MSSALSPVLFHPAQELRGRWARGLLGTALGTTFTAGLFLGIARFDRQAPVSPPPDIADLHLVALQEPPPPPPEVQRHVEEVATPLSGIEAVAAESPVQLTVTPPDLAALLPPPPVAPPATISAGQLYADLKPKMDLTGLNDHVYQMAEVDQLPQVLRKVAPELTGAYRRNASRYRTTVLFVVEANGEVKDVRVIGSSGEPEVDALVVAAIERWTFAPAVRRGKKVRCLLQQLTIIKSGRGSPLTL